MAKAKSDRRGFLLSYEYEGPDGPTIENVACRRTLAEAEALRSNVRRLDGSIIPTRIDEIAMEGRRYFDRSK
jgi:hypothetical protein